MSVLRREQKYLVTAVQTDAVHNWGSAIQAYGAANGAAVVANRLSRGTQRIGALRVRPNGDGRVGGRPGSGFGPTAPVVVGSSIAFRGPKVIRARARLLSDQQRQGTSTLRRPILPPVATFVARPTAVTLAYSLRGEAKSLLGRPIVGGGVAFGGPGVRFAGPQARMERLQRAPRSRLSTPVVVFPAVAIQGPSVRLTGTGDTVPTVKSRLFPPIIPPVATQTFIGPATHLADSSYGKPKSRLGVPTPDGAVIYGGPGVRLTPPRNRNPHTISILRPTTGLTPIEATLARPPLVHLAPSSRGIPNSFLRAPVVVNGYVADAVADVTLTYSLRGKPKSRLRPPTVVAPVLARPIVTRLARIAPSPIHSVLRHPVVVAPVLARPIDLTLARIRPVATRSILRRPVDLVDQQDVGLLRTHLAYSLRGRPKSGLGEPVVVAPVLARAIFVGLSYSLRGTAKSRLAPPTAVAPVLARPIDFTFARIRPVPVQQILGKPTDLVDQQDLGFVRVSLAPSSQGKAKSFLRSPVVVNGFVVEGVVEVVLTRIRPPRTTALLRRPISVAVVEPLARPVSVTLSPSSSGRAKSILRGPVVVAPVLAKPIAIGLALSSRGIPKSRLRSPVVIGPVLARPIDTTLARITPPATLARLFQPADLVDRQDAGALRAHLAYSRRGTPKSHLSLTAIIDLRPQAYFITTELAPSFRGKPKPFLGRPTDLVDAQDLGFVRVYLSYGLRGKAKSLFAMVVYPTRVYAPISGYLTKPRDTAPATHSTLRRPVDLVDRDDLGFARVHLAYQSRRPGRGLLRSPVVIDLRPQVYYVTATLAPSFRGEPKSILGKPADLVDQQDLGLTSATLTYSRRGAPKSRLSLTEIIDLRPQAYFVAISLVRITPAPVHSVLRRPTDLVDVQDLGSVRTTLAYSLRGNPKSLLGQPADLVDAQDVGFASITLAYSLRGRPKARLGAPTVVAPVLAESIKVNLARIKPAPTRSRLRSPAVIDLTPQVQYLDLLLTYSRRGEPKSLLPQASLFAPQPKAETVVAVTLAYSLRGKPKSGLGEPVVVTPATPYLRPTSITLAYSLRGEPKAKLGTPAVVQTFRIPKIDVTLAPQKRGTPTSRLFPPTDLIDRQDLGTIQVTLAPSERGTPKSILRKPVVVTPRVEDAVADITLARIRPARTHSFLRAPIVVNALIADAVADVTLARIRPRIVSSVLRKPAVVGSRDSFRGPLVSLAPSSRETAKSFRLAPPTSIVTPVARPVAVHLTYSKRGKPLSVLGRPIVLNANAAYPQGPMVQLAPSSRGKPKSRIFPPAVSLRLAPVETVIATTLAYGVRGKPKSHLTIAILYPGTPGIVCSEVLDLAEVCGDTTDLSGILQGAVLDENVASGDDIEESTAAGENLDIYHVDGEVL